MPQLSRASLWSLLNAAGDPSHRFIADNNIRVRFNALERGTSLDGRIEEFRGQNVLIRADRMLTAVLALIELDGVAARVVLCPPDLASGHLPYVVEAADIGAVVSDRTEPESEILNVGRFVTCRPSTFSPGSERRGDYPTEWVLFTSGTTGRPKMVMHTLPGLTGPVRHGGLASNDSVWSTFYDIRRYGGLQILLRALVGGGCMVLSSATEPLADFMARAGALGVTHISGTPSHWRRALMTPEIDRLSPQYVRLSGEVADQPILDQLRNRFPRAKVAHAFASTEAGVAFDVTDGLAGFPASLIGQTGGDVEMRIEDGSLCIRSARTASRYLGDISVSLLGDEGYVDTGDLVQLRGERYYFVGRREGIINVGGLKVHPEEVEAVINEHPAVQISLVKARLNPITGAIVVADVVARASSDAEGADASGASEMLKREILEACRAALAPHKVPALLRFVPSLNIAASGKLARLRE
jgi:acyl-CoA synthetase (AMP-forming)/AMP-acid ligase II